MRAFPLAVFALLRTAPPADERNVALLQEPADLMAAAEVTDGNLPADRAGFGAARRVWAMPGPGASLRGLATVLQDALLRRVPGWQVVPPEDLVPLGAALYQVGRRIDAGAAEPLTGDAATRRWLVGTAFPLPVWQPVGEKLTVDVAALRAAMATVGPLSQATLGRWTPAVQDARPLDQVDPFHVHIAVRGAAHVRHALDERVRLDGEAAGVSTAAGAQALGTTWGRNARWNPYAAVFPVLQFAANWRANAPDRLAPFTTAFYAAFTAAELKLFASTSAGYVLIRCLWRGSEAGRTKPIADLLGTTQANRALVDDYPPATGRLEPPVADGRIEPKLPTVDSKAGAPNPLMGFGRLVPFVVGAYQGNFRGVRWPGTVPPIEVLAPAAGAPLPHEFVIPPGGNRAQWSRILAAIATTEGNLDAVTAWDSATLSLGFQQWSMHVTDSGPTLLARFKQLHPETYDAVVRSAEVDAGLGVDVGTSTGVGIADIVTMCKLWALSPAGTVHLNPPGYKRARVQTGLGWRRVGEIWVIGEPCDRLAARWAVAARFIPEMWQAQVESAYAGIVRLQKSLRGGAVPNSSESWQNWAGTIKVADVPGLPDVDENGVRRRPTVFDLFPSEAAVASILDHSVNLPGDVPAAVQKAIVHATAAYLQTPRPAPVVVTPEYLLRILMAHQGKRQLTPGGVPVDVARERVPRLILLYDSPRGMSNTATFDWPTP